LAGMMWLTLVAPGKSRAQESSANPSITLEQAVQMALQQNPAFQTSKDDADAARARLKQMQSAWYPRFDFNQGFTRGNNPIYVFGTKLTQRQFSASDFALNRLNTPTPLDNFQTRLDGRWRLFDSGQTLLHQRSAKRLVTAADFETEQARQDLILEIVKAYYGVLVMKQNVKAAEEAANRGGSATERKAGGKRFGNHPAWRAATRAKNHPSRAKVGFFSSESVIDCAGPGKCQPANAVWFLR